MPGPPATDQDHRGSTARTERRRRGRGGGFFVRQGFLVVSRRLPENLAHLLDGEHDREFELGIAADEFDFGGPGAAEGFSQKSLRAQMAWVEVWRASFFSVLRWRK